MHIPVHTGVCVCVHCVDRDVQKCPHEQGKQHPPVTLIIIGLNALKF